MLTFLSTKRLLHFLFLLLLFILLSNSTGTVYGQSACATIERVEYTGASQGTNRINFTCRVTVAPQFAGSEFIACGTSINGEFSSNTCPSDTRFGGWFGNQALIDCEIDPQITGTKELVAYDFRPHCGPTSGTRAAINFANLPTTVPTSSIPSPTEFYVSGNIKTDSNPDTSSINDTDGPPGMQRGKLGTSPLAFTTPSNSSLEKNAKDFLLTCRPPITRRTSVGGPPSITLEEMKNILKSYNSPALPEAQPIYELGVKYGIDPMMLLIFFAKESTMGQFGSSRPNKNIGNIVCTSAHARCNGRFRVYSSWTESATDWYRLIKDLYINDWGLYYFETILPEYAPPDENDTCLYINQITTWYDTKFNGKNK